MYISRKRKAVFIRNLSASIINSLITLVLLLIAPLGLATVITNTIAVGISTFMVCTGLDLVTLWLLKEDKRSPFHYRDYPYSENLGRKQQRDIEVRKDYY